MQALGPLAVGGKNEIICTTCLDMTPATSAHISLARASHVTKPDFKGMGLCNSAVCSEEEKENVCSTVMTTLDISSFTRVAPTTTSLLK